jgi:hypothetical protein
VARRHRLITVPSGLLVFACIALPAYRQCGRNTAMCDDPYLASACTIGLLVAVAALVSANRRFERGVAVASLVVTVLVLALFELGLVAMRPVYAGLTIGHASALTLLSGTVLWLREVREREIGRAPIIVGGLATVLLVATALVTTWVPPPPREADVNPFLVH